MTDLASRLHSLHWDQNLNIREMAGELGLCRKTVVAAMDRLGVPRRTLTEAIRLSHSSPAATKYRDREWLQCAYHDQGLSLSQIADMLGCHPTTISKWMGRHGIETRRAEEALRIRAEW